MTELLNDLTYWTEEKDKAEKHIKDIKEQLESEFLTEEGYKDEFITISYSKPSRSLSVDLKALEKKEPQLYSDLLNDYQKITEKKGSFSYRFK